MKGILKEFREFALKSSFFDVAIGIFIGAGLTPVATSFVKDIMMPVLGYFVGRVDFMNLFFVIQEGNNPGPYVTLELAKKAGAITVNYGVFINTTISFLMISWVAFWLVKLINRIKNKEQSTESVIETPTTKECQYCFSKISVKATKCSACTADL